MYGKNLKYLDLSKNYINEIDINNINFKFYDNLKKLYLNDEVIIF